MILAVPQAEVVASVKARSLVTAGVLASVATMVNNALPRLVDVPVRTPVEESSEKPVGSALPAFSA